MEKSKFYLYLGLGVLAFSIIWLILVFFQIEGDLGEYANTPRTIPFFLGICMSILGLVFLYQYKLGFRPKQSVQPLKKNEIRNIIICVILFLIYAYILELFGFILSTPIVIYFITRFLLKEKNWKLNFAFPILMTALIYFIFIILLKSSLPRGTLIQLI